MGQASKFIWCLSPFLIVIIFDVKVNNRCYVCFENKYNHDYICKTKLPFLSSYIEEGLYMNKNLNWYRRRTIRLKEYDYSSPGAYFVTICVKNRQEYFGKIKNGGMVFNDYGTVIAIHWADIPKHYSNVILDEWVVMPNHIHGIIVITSDTSFVGTAHCAVPTNINPVSLSQIIKSFKDATTKRIRSEFGNIRFVWQRSFYDHIIRTEAELARIREYIHNNPLNWEHDVYYMAPPDKPIHSIGFNKDR